ncbi:MAG: hypothetical protein SOY76_02880 [Veillonella caviae]|nr:hypothetical protein [Veillonella caviae]
MSTKFNSFNNYDCPVCGQFPHHAVVCHLNQANICMKHCYENGRCKYQEIICGQAHCQYKETAAQVRDRVLKMVAKSKGLPP